MKYVALLICYIGLLTGCQPLNFKTEPELRNKCQYNDITGIEFQFNKLVADQVEKGFQHIYVAQSKSSATLSANYQGLKGKLTGKIIERNYPLIPICTNRSKFSLVEPLSYDEADDLCLSPKQRAIRARQAKFIFQQAILQNCQIIYISVDSLATNYQDPILIENANLSIINDK